MHQINTNRNTDAYRSSPWVCKLDRVGPKNNRLCTAYLKKKKIIKKTI